ncbi:UNKNOWN [Stylonychia lemnae]|uniref:Transmembrane protein n=1 Tax=Stylonychia lemnae TaxID=5949 RepID=A0A077ZYG9_STYLE|nr:UNKNOWN [Stylonychia lemnae]|eukprot:CDW73581.1 UNKNOWN [Stylonychia lemnae]
MQLIDLNQAIYVISLIYVSMYRPAGDIYDSEGNKVGESYGNTNMDYFGLILFGLVTRTTYRMICNSLEDGLQPEYALDIFAINLFSQLLLSFTRYGWWVYMLVPCYIGYKVSGWIWAYLSRTTAPANDAQEEIDPKLAKKQAKDKKKEDLIEDDNIISRHKVQSTISYLRPVMDSRITTNQKKQNLLTPTTATHTQLGLATSHPVIQFNDSSNNVYHSVLQSNRTNGKPQTKQQTVRSGVPIGIGMTSPRLTANRQNKSTINEKQSNQFDRNIDKFGTPKSSERSLITIHGIQDAENFEKDINDIMNIVDDIEKNLKTVNFIKKPRINMQSILNQSANIVKISKMNMEQRRQSQQYTQRTAMIGDGESSQVKKGISHNFFFQNQIGSRCRKNNRPFRGTILNQSSIEDQNFNSNQAQQQHQRDVLARSMELKRPQNFKIRKQYIKGQNSIDRNHENANVNTTQQTINNKNKVEIYENGIIPNKLILQNPFKIRSPNNLERPVMTNSKFNTVIDTENSAHYDTQSSPDQFSNNIRSVQKNLENIMVQDMNQTMRQSFNHQQSMNSSSNGNSKIVQQLIDYDQLLIQIFNQRKFRYVSEFYNQNDSQNEDGFTESKINIDIAHIEKDQDEELVRNRAYEFLMSDLQDLRQIYTVELQKMIQRLEQQDDEFSKERQFFLKQAKINEKTEQDLRARISYLEQELDDEKNHNIETLIRENVASVCEIALLNYQTQASRHQGQTQMDANQEEKKQKQMNYKELYNESRQQYIYELKINKKVLNMMENKVSNLIAENGSLNNYIVKLKALNEEIESMAKIREDQLNGQILKNKDLQGQMDALVYREQNLQAQQVPVYEFDKLNADYQKAIDCVGSLQIRNQILEQDKKLLVSQLVNVKNSISWINNVLGQKFADFTENIAEKMKKLNSKVEKIQFIFNETLLYTNKTYFLEEIYKMRSEVTELKKKNGLLSERIKVMKHHVDNGLQKQQAYSESNTSSQVRQEIQRRSPTNSISSNHKGRHVKINSGVTVPSHLEYDREVRAIHTDFNDSSNNTQEIEEQSQSQ